MINPDLNEHEQVEQIKAWWSKYGSSIILGVLLGLAAMYGWQFMQKKHDKYIEAASQEYQQLLVSLAEQDSDVVKKQATKIIADYHRSSYAWLANLYLAQIAVEEKDYSTAVDKLDWVRNNATDPGFQAIAAIRMARVQLAQGDFDAALKSIAHDVDPAFTPLVDEVRGDIHLAMDSTDDAREAYRTATKAQQPHPFLLLKLSDLEIMGDKT